MRFLIAAAALAAASLMTAPRAEAASYCYDGEHGMTCGFISLQQCLESLSGNDAGTCAIDPMTPTREVVRKQPRKHTAN
jgi:Spy/CpxP family protein refolding chaperone